MDLFAYSKIDDLDAIAKANGIVIPRLRGYRMMEAEEPYSEKQIADTLELAKHYELERAVESIPRFSLNPEWTELSSWTDYLKKYYLNYKTVKEKGFDGKEYEDMRATSIKWDLIHGKHRKNVKFLLKKARKAVLNDLNTFNKYAGQKDVLYIHCRMGDTNSARFRGMCLDQKPWFLEAVDDWFDPTYCTIYAKIKI